MKRGMLLIGMTFLTLLSVTPKSYGAEGTERGGADYYSFYEQYSKAWFLGNEPIRYCYETGKDFGVSDEGLRAALDKTFQRWERYIREKLPPVSDPRLNYPMEHKLVVCDGNEDLKLFFGKSNSETDEAKKRYKNPIAFPKQTKVGYEKPGGRSKGFIWLAPRFSIDLDSVTKFPDWADGHSLETTLLHEVGHVEGMGHIPGTVMDAEIAYHLAFNRTGTDGLTHLNSIDQSAELSSSLVRKYQGQVSFVEEASKKTFFKLAGRSAQGTIRASLEFSNDPDVLAWVTLADDVGPIVMKLLRLQTRGELYGSGGESLWIFNRKIFEGGSGSRHQIYTESVLLQAPDGATYAASLSRNMYLSYFFQRPLVIHFIVDRERHNLFDAILERY